ncbi:MAG: sigma-70 family RNA polymerase sigma factor [Bacteroidetes bacterium]|nr:sigma-70 family RNA polymerase sigma factor [Bacteroidota bacterium]
MTAIETISEIELVQLCRNGDEQAQRQLYSRYVGAMFHTVLRLTANREDAEDLTQEVFIKVFEKLDSFRGESTVGAWIKRVAVNTTLNFLRQANRLKMVAVESQNLPPEAEPEVDETAWANDIRRIHEAMGELPDGCRLVFNLHLLEGYRHQDVAQMLGITESTSKTQYMRAKRILREKLMVGN